MRLKPLHILLAIFVMASMSIAADKTDVTGKVQYEKKIEDTLQRMADAVAGAGQVIVAVEADMEPGVKNISYTKQADLALKATPEAGKKNQYIMPGVPAMKNLNASDAGTSLPFNYKEEASLGEVRKVSVTLLFNKQVPGNTVAAVRKIVDSFLRGRSKDKNIIILKEDFNPSGKSGFNTAFGQFADKNEAKLYMTGILKEATRDVLKIIPSNSGQPLEIKDTTVNDGNSGLMSKRNLIIGAGVVGFVILVIIGLFVVLIMSVMKSGGGKASGSSSGSGQAGAIPAGMGMAQNMGESAISGKIVASDDADEALDASLRERKFFSFINSSNVHKLKHLLQIKIALNEASPKTVAMVLSCLPPDISAKILVEYPPKIQAEIVSVLVNLEQYEEEEVLALEKEIADKISTLLGGGYAIRNLIESLSTENKKSLTKTIAQRYPTVLQDIRDFIVLFEDILGLEESAIKRIFTELDPDTIATAICKSPVSKQEMIIRNISKGNAEMIAQWIELKSNNISFMEIEEAQSRIIRFAKKLESEGHIKIDKIDFLKPEA